VIILCVAYKWNCYDHIATTSEIEKSGKTKGFEICYEISVPSKENFNFSTSVQVFMWPILYSNSTLNVYVVFNVNI